MIENLGLLVDGYFDSNILSPGGEVNLGRSGNEDRSSIYPVNDF